MLHMLPQKRQQSEAESIERIAPVTRPALGLYTTLKLRDMGYK